MFPTIIVSKSPEHTALFLENFIKQNHFVEFNITRLSPIKTDYSIAEMKGLKTELLISSVAPRLVIIDVFDHSSPEAQNSMLKTLEEPKNTQFILVVTDIDKLLPTVQSRCRVIKIGEASDAVLPEILRFYTRFNDDTTASFLADPLVTGVTKETAELFLHNSILYFRSVITQKNSTEVLKIALSTKGLLMSNNLNPQLAIDHFLLQTKRLTAA